MASGVDPDWLTSALIEGGAVNGSTGARIVEWTPSAIGTGQMAENVRVGLRWDGAPAQAPSSVVIKVPSSSETSRATAAAGQNYGREVGFYRDLRPRVDIRTPVPLAIAENPAAGTFALVMEDISPAQAGDQLTGCSPEQAELAVGEVARLHGSTWGRDELVELDWLDQPSPQSVANRAALYDAVFDGFAQRYAGALTDDELELGRWLGQNLEAWMSLDRGARCVTHGDFRLDNLLFGTGPGAPPLTTVDWQTPSYGYGVNDLAYFLSAGLSVTDRRAHQDHLIDHYHRTLAGYGIDLDNEALRAGYRLGSATGYLMAVVASQIVTQTERGDQMFLVMARGSATMMTEFDLPDGLA